MIDSPQDIVYIQYDVEIKDFLRFSFNKFQKQEVSSSKKIGASLKDRLSNLPICSFHKKFDLTDIEEDIDLGEITSDDYERDE